MTVLLLVTGACFASLAGAAAAADLAVAVDGPASATAGASVAYQVAVTNNGVDDATTVQLTDATPANTTFVSLVQDTGPAFMCTSPGLGGTGDSTCAIATLVPGASATFTLTVHIDNAVSGGTFITDVATTTADNDDNSENDQGSAATQVTPVTLADLQAVVTGPDGAARFSDVTYRISVTNSGPDAAPATLTDDVPSGTSFVSLTQTTGPGFTCTTPPIGNGGTVSCDLASFAAGATATFVLVVHIDASTPAGSFVSDIATVATTATDPTEENNTSGTATLVGSANMSVTATGPAAATAGSQISYTLTLANSGPDDAHYVVLTDDLPADTTFVSFVQDTAGPPTLALSTPAVGGTGTVTASVNPPLSDFTAGTSIQFTLTVAIDTVIRDPTTITNTASASSSYLDPNPANNQATVTTTATGGTATPVPTTTPDPTPTPTTTPDPTPTPTTTPDASPTVTTEPSPTVTAEPSPTVTPTATPTPSATPVVVCPRVPKLKRATFRRAKRKLRRAGCAGKLHHRGKLRRHGKPTHVSSQRPKPGRPFRLGGRLSVKLR